MFDTWYQEFGKMVEDKPDPTGTADRMKDTILKVAMCLSLSNSTELIIHPYIMQQAMESCLGTISSVKHVTAGKGESIMGRQTKMVIDRIDRKFPDYMDRKSLLAAGWGDFDAIDLDRIIETLLQAGAIEARRNGTTILYKMRVEAHEQLVRFQREIQ